MVSDVMGQCHQWDLHCSVRPSRIKRSRTRLPVGLRSLMCEKSTSSFINVLLRFTALRGEVRLIFSDQGIHFVSATSEMNINVIDINYSNLVEDFMKTRGTQCKFNQPNASHLGEEAYWSFSENTGWLALECESSTTHSWSAGNIDGGGVLHS